MAERPLTEGEVAVVRFVADAVGAVDVSAQSELARVTAARHHGGIWLDIEVPSNEISRYGSLTGHLPPEGGTVSVMDASGGARGGVLLWLDEGLLTALEVYDWVAQGEEVPFPQSEHLRFEPSNSS